MGNDRFRLSDMIPNAWFHKLKGMGKRSGRNQKNNTNNSCKKKHQNQHHPTSSSSLSSSSYSSTSASAKPTTTQRKSYYFTRDLINCPPPPHISPDPPRKSSKKRRTTAKKSSRTTTPRMVPPPVSAACSCRASMESVWTKPDSTPEEYPDSPLDSTSYSSEHDSLLPELVPRRVPSAAATPETFDRMLSLSASEDHAQCDIPDDDELQFDTVSKIDLPPIITKPRNKFEESVNDLRMKGESNQACKFDEKHGYRSLSVKIVKNSDNIVTKSREQRTCPARRLSGNSPGLKLRTNSPRIGSRRIQGRRSTSSTSANASIVQKSFAVVKSSNDPQRDFRESMVEMIAENNIRASKDLENLLACYLSLNSNEYHDLIIKVFKQIWFDITDVRLK